MDDIISFQMLEEMYLLSSPISVHWLSVYYIWPLLCWGMFLLSLFRALIMKGFLKCVKGHFQASGDDCVISICVIILIQLTNLCMFESTFHSQEENNLFIAYDHFIVLLKAFYWKKNLHLYLSWETVYNSLSLLCPCLVLLSG